MVDKISGISFFVALGFILLSFVHSNQVFAANECSSFEPPETVLPIMDGDGSFSKILVYGEYFSDSSDPEDVSAALRAAGLKAKASLSKFLGEETETEDTLLEMSNSLKEKGANGKNITTQRLKVQVQNIKSKSKEVLRALIKLSDCYEPKTNRVMVEWGTNLELLNVSNEMKGLFQNSNNANKSSSGSKQSASDEQGGFNRQNSLKKDF